MPDILLATLNAKYIHAAFGLRYLFANLGELQVRAEMVEFDIHHRPVDVVEALLARNPKIIGLGVYVWNAAPITELVSLLKRLRPEIIVVLGGPEISFEWDQQPIAQWADYIITGEADLAFAALCRQILEHRPPAAKVIAAAPPALDLLALPYDLYTEQDIAQRILYFEASRGCPFGCEFCLSSIGISMRQWPLPVVFEQLNRLMDRGVKQFKFVDRTFNIHAERSLAVLEFCLAHYQEGIFFHFEMIPGHLPDAMRDLLRKFPAGALQFEVGIQTWNEEVVARINRRQDNVEVEESIRFLREETGVHVHADLIVGLPGESLESFGAGLDRLVALRPQEIQVGILKRLRGAPIARHTEEWQMVYSPQPPYEILQNKLIPFADFQRMRRFARYWDLVSNSGHFLETAPLIWTRGETVSPFAGFLRWSDWLFANVGRTDQIALIRLMERVFRYLVEENGMNPADAAQPLLRDYHRNGHSDTPPFLNTSAPVDASSEGTRRQRRDFKRQSRHSTHPNNPI